MSQTVASTGLWAHLADSEVVGRQNGVKMRNAFFASGVWIYIYLFHAYVLHIHENKSCLYSVFSRICISAWSVCPNPKDNRWMSRECLYHLLSLSLLSGHINFSSCSVISVSRDARSIRLCFLFSDISCEICCLWLRGSKACPGSGKSLWLGLDGCSFSRVVYVFMESFQ